MKRTGFYIGMVILLAPLWVWADTAYPIITFDCDAENNILKIKNEVKWEDEGRNFKFSAAEGTYNPWDWVNIEKIADGNAKLVSQKGPLMLTCKLGRDTYKIQLEAKIFNRNYDGSCGNKISAVATIYRGNILLVDHQEFESYCHGNAPVVRGIKITGDTGEVKVVTIPKFQFY